MCRSHDLFALALLFLASIGCGPEATEPIDLTDAGGLDATVGDAQPDAALSEDAQALDGAPADETPDPLACNGARHLCDRPLPEVSFLLGHNAHAVQPPFSRFAANHTTAIEAQLALGARGVGIKLYWTDHPDCGPLGLYGYHGFERLGCVPFSEIAAPVAAFLAEHPREVLVMTVEGGASGQRVMDGLEATGLAPWRYGGPEGGAWPTLGELIEAETRLLVLKAGGGGGLPDLWQVVQDTPYAFEATDEMGCEANRGPADAPLFQVNHFLTRLRPVPEEAAQTNSWAVLGGRVADCAEARGWPTILLMDFLGAGDAPAVVHTLNGPGTPAERLAAVRAAAEAAAP